MHSNGIIIIHNGEFDLASGDDAIHADTNLVIHDGKIEITKSYEGIESSYIEINGGEIAVISSDDGVNVAGGNDSSSVNGRIGENNFSNVSNSNRKLVINGGNLTVDVTGDGLDVNGSIYINGGTVFIKGTTNSGNGALDYDEECIITGGECIIYGATGMWQNPSNTSTQNILIYQCNGNVGDVISIKDSNGNEVVSFKTEKTYGAIAISNKNIENNETYTLYKNNTDVGSISVTSILNTYGSTGRMGGGTEGGMQKGPGGRGF